MKKINKLILSSLVLTLSAIPFTAHAAVTVSIEDSSSARVRDFNGDGFGANVQFAVQRLYSFAALASLFFPKNKNRNSAVDPTWFM